MLISSYVCNYCLLTKIHVHIVIMLQFKVVVQWMDWKSLTKFIKVYFSHHICRFPSVHLLTWLEVNQCVDTTMYYNILAVMDLILTLPGSSAECERGFRVLKSLKTDVRSRLGESALSDQLIIKLESPNIQWVIITCLSCLTTNTVCHT